VLTNKEKSFISAVVYVNNNESNIVEFLDGLINTLKTGFEKFEIICVDDASEDASVAKIRGVAEQLENGIVSIINMSYFQGLEASMNAGVDLAIGDFVFEFDNNVIDYELSLIMDVYKQSLQGYDIVAASNAKRRLSSTLFYSLFNRNAKMQYELTTETFRILSRRAINRIHSMSKTIPYRKAVYANCGLKTNLIFYERSASIDPVKSKRAEKNRYDVAINSLILFTDVAYKIAIFLALLMMGATLAGVFYTIAIFILGQPVAGYTTIMLVTTGGFFGVFSILGIIIKFLSILVDLVFKKQKYVIESIEKISK